MTTPATASSATRPDASARPSTRWWTTVGPGLVFALTVIGPGDLVSNAAVGATHGYALLWLLAMAVVFRFVWLETSARYVLITGESLIAGYARVGRWLVWVILAAVVVYRHISNLFKVVLLGGAVHLLLPLPTRHSIAIHSLFVTVAGFVLMSWEGYRGVERFCKAVVVLMGAALVVVALLSGPEPSAIARGMLVPSIPPSAGLYSTILLVTAIIGTEAGSLTNITYSYFIREKGWRGAAYFGRQRLDLAFSVGCIFVMGALLQIAAAGTIHSSDARLETAEDLVRIFSESLGVTGRVIFAVGLWAKVFTSVLGGTTGYALVASDIWRQLVASGRATPATGAELGEPPRRDRVYRAMVAFWSFSPLYVLWTDWKPVWLVLFSSAVVVLLIPVLGVGLLRLTNDARLMGRHRNGLVTNAILLALVAVSLFVIYQNGVTWWDGIATE
jgi:Mn2+/Fe2+ NRAMP family transporter